jgi:hypothetical protein
MQVIVSAGIRDEMYIEHACKRGQYAGSMLTYRSM